MTRPEPAPGSDEAIELGCECPRVDNHYGRGYYAISASARHFVVNLDCPLHGADPLPDLRMRPRLPSETGGPHVD